jgi:hypothetical protein
LRPRTLGAFQKAMTQRRKNLRRPINHPCWIDTGSGNSLIPGQLQNISVAGAKLVVRESDVLPEEFTVYLTQDGKIGRRARVAWRTGAEVGLKILGPAPPGEPPESVILQA